MHSGNHIPSYLLLERFAKGRHVLDLFAPDEQGLGLLLNVADSVTLVQRTRQDHPMGTMQGLQRLVAEETNLPFRQGVFDMVLMLNPDVDSVAFDLETQIKQCRYLLSPTGIAAFLLPNVESQGGARASGKIPDFLDLERLLRHFFPHLMMFAQQPLYGATLSPIGRRVKDDSPLLDDRMLPEEGEPPDFFVALASAKYHRLDDTVIAQLPFLPMADAFRLQVEKYEGSLRLVQAEKRARDKKLALLTKQVDELNDKVLQAELEVRDREALAARVTYLDEQIVRKDAALADVERKASEKSHQQIALEESVHELQREIRRLTQQVSDRERAVELLQKERDEHEADRQQLMSELHGAQSELKARQRQLDEQIEDVASREAELELLRRDIGSLRDSLLKEREERQKLSLLASERENYSAVVEAMEKELNKIRVLSQNERHRLEAQFEEEHRKLLEEITVREDIRRKAHMLELQVKELELAAETDRAHAEAQSEDMQALMIRLEMLQNERKEFQKEKRDSDSEIEALQQKVQSLGNELERSRHLVQLVTARAEEAEGRYRDLQQRISALQAELGDAEQRCSELQLVAHRLEQFEEKYSTALTRITELEEALAVAEGRNRAAAAHRTEHVAELEERYADAINQVRELKAEVQQKETAIIERETDSMRLAQLEERYRVAMAQVDSLQGEVAEYRPVVSSVATFRQQAETADLKYLEEQSAHQKTRAMLLDARSRISKMESDLSQEQLDHQKTRQALQQNLERIGRLESDLTAAMGALAEHEEGTEQEVKTAAEKVRHLRNELVRLQHENETELLCVREDLETELRHSLRRLEQAQQEIWELREEVIRMKAQSAATAAASAKQGINEEFQKTLIEQEILIETVNSEREQLRIENEHLKKSLLNRKKNIRILATLLRREHYEHTLSAENIRPLSIPDIRRLVESEGGDIADELDFLDDPSTDRPFIRSSITPGVPFSDDDVVDAIMESVVVNGGSIAPDHEASTHIHVETLAMDDGGSGDGKGDIFSSVEAIADPDEELIDNRPSYDPDAINPVAALRLKKMRKPFSDDSDS
ncbi:MAG: hypothetical protein JXX14_00125 [Deltaproteobacteria bacterium]|nr:hypothetical protein [Deltaproteobacteria bacterium]